MRRALALCLFLLLAGVARPHAARADSLSADLSHRLIAITSSFTGSSILVFGAVVPDGPGRRDVVIVLRGPDQSLRVRRKERVFGIWVNAAAHPFIGVPAYYAVAATRPLEDIGAESHFARHQIGLDALRPIDYALPEGAPPDPAATPFRDAIRRLKERNGLYNPIRVPVTFIGPNLFRAEFQFPSNVPVGSYKAEIYLFNDGELAGANASALFVDKTGLERWVFKAARNYPALYGIAAVAIAVAFGWGAAVVFRRA
ncbi:TIGR02186 family protein [Zavarzinia compransoris]|uniref:TIGR02186 family protein n=1 Tax=Zavarzinia marina TaxID=2911065 RepID=UPI001F3CC65D|nr:TIGR02186 family protein [Zavarzinia marina]MCF4167217.1 TIGR02186 family protein [Zavarzinia marina]